MIYFFYILFSISLFFKQLDDTQILMISGSIIILSFFALGLKFFNKKEQLEINVINSLIFFWLLNNCIPILFNLVQSTAQSGLFASCIWIFSFAIVATNNSVEKNWILFKKLMIYFGCIFACWAITQHYLYDYMASGPFTTRNINGAFLMVTALLLASKLLYEKEALNNTIINKSFSYLMLFIINLALLLSFSRGVYLSYGLSLLVLTVFNVKRFKNIAILGAIIVSSLIVLQLSAPDAIQHRLDMLTTEQSRMVIWKGAWHLWQNSSWYGIGINNFKYFYPAFSLPGDGSSLEYAHNDYLQLLIETGISGICIFLTLLLALLYYCIRYLKKVQWSADGHITITTQMAVLFSLLLYSCVDYAFYIVPFNILLGITIGFLYQNLKNVALISSIQWNIKPVHQKIFGAVGGANFIFLGTLFVHLFFYNYYDSQARDYTYLKDFSEAIKLYQQANEHFNTPYTYNSITSLYMERIKEESDTASKLKLIAKAEKVIAETISLHPYNADPYFQEAIIQSLYLNDNEKAQAAFERFMKLKPHANFERLTYCFFLLKQEQPYSAQELLEKGLHYPIDSYYAPKYLDLLAQLRSEHGDEFGAEKVDDALSHLETFNLDFSSLAVS